MLRWGIRGDPEIVLADRVLHVHGNSSRLVADQVTGSDGQGEIAVCVVLVGVSVCIGKV